MSTRDRDEFGVLFEAQAGRTLTRAEEARLRALAASDPSRADELGALDELHALLDAERALRREAAAPTSTQEESDEGFVRLARVAAFEEDALRARLLHAGPPQGGRFVAPSTRRRAWLWIAAAVVVVAVAARVISELGVDRPALIEGRPDGAVLGGGARIVLRTELRASQPELSWHPVVGASSYDAEVEDAEGRALFARPAAAARSTAWELTPDQVETLLRLREAGTEARLRIVARDGAGLTVASSGDLPLRVVD